MSKELREIWTTLPMTAILVVCGVLGGLAMILSFYIGVWSTAADRDCTASIKQVYAAFVVNGENTQAEMAQLYEACDFAEIDEALSR